MHPASRRQQGIRPGYQAMVCADRGDSLSEHHLDQLAVDDCLTCAVNHVAKFSGCCFWFVLRIAVRRGFVFDVIGTRDTIHPLQRQMYFRNSVDDRFKTFGFRREYDDVSLVQQAVEYDQLPRKNKRRNRRSGGIDSQLSNRGFEVPDRFVGDVSERTRNQARQVRERCDRPRIQATPQGFNRIDIPGGFAFTGADYELGAGTNI